MRASSSFSLWRCGPASMQRSLLAAPALSRTLDALRFQRRGDHTVNAADVPPPLAAAPLRRSSAKHLPLSATTFTASATSTRAPPAMRDGAWMDALAPQTHGPAPSRVALSEAAALCLSVETPKCYAVYRPCRRGADPSSPPLAAPHHFIDLLRHLRGAANLSLEARRVAEVLVDLLNKAPHPSCPGPWDVTQSEARELKARAIASAMDSAAVGEDALLWAAEVLGLRDTQADAGSAAMPPPALLKMAVMERVDTRDGPLSPRIAAKDPDGAWMLSGSPIVVGAVAAAMLRCTADGAKSDALELLEAAALARLSRGSSSPSSAAAPSGSPGASPSSTVYPSQHSPLLFNEDVAVHCAEVAAVRGDVETVTRLIFLLYRARGALGFATLADLREQRRSSEGRGGTQSWMMKGLLPRAPRWVRASWWNGSASVNTAAAPLEADDDDDVRFEQAVVRLLKSAMHAVLFQTQHGESGIDEALSLWDGLRGGTSWPGLAAMGTELLSFLAEQHAIRMAAVGWGESGTAAEAHLQQTGLRVYGQLCRAAPLRQRTGAQQDVLHRCTALTMRLLSSTMTAHIAGSATTVPTVATAAAAERILCLFADAGRSAQGVEELLPYALAASLTVLSVAATHKTYKPPASLFSGLVAYFSEAQSMHYYCVASSNATAASLRVATCGGLLLLHALLLSSAPMGPWAREQSGLSNFLQRLRGLDGGKEGGVRQLGEEDATLLLSRLGICGEHQRQLLWSPLLSLKRGDAQWCSATLALFASPAASAAVYAGVASIASALYPGEAQALLPLLYECGNTDEPVAANQALDIIVEACTQTPVHTETLGTLTEHLQRAAAVNKNVAVVVLGAASLCALAQRREPADARDAGDVLERLLRVVQPLLTGSVSASTSVYVAIVLTPACLSELQRLRRQRGDAAAENTTDLAQALHDALCCGVSHARYRVSVASAWPALPATKLALSQDEELRALDGLREVTAAARHLEHAFPRESRPAAGLWVEELVLPPLTLASHTASAARDNLLQHYGVRAISTHRAHMEKAKSDIFSLLRPASAETACETDGRQAAGSATAEASAARRVRNESLLSAVTPKRKGQRTL